MLFMAKPYGILALFLFFNSPFFKISYIYLLASIFYVPIHKSSLNNLTVVETSSLLVQMKHLVLLLFSFLPLSLSTLQESGLTVLHACYNPGLSLYGNSHV